MVLSPLSLSPSLARCPLLVLGMPPLLPLALVRTLLLALPSRSSLTPHPLSSLPFSASSPPQIVPDGEVAVSLDRIETHLTSLLTTINAKTNPAKPPLGPRALARAAEAKAAEEAAEAARSASRGVSDAGELDDGAEAAAPAPLVPQPPPYPKPSTAGGSSEQRVLQSMGAARGGNNVRVFTFEEIDKVLDDLPEEEPEGIDDDGNELNLTRRTKRSPSESPGRRGGGGGKPQGKGGGTGAKRAGGAPPAPARMS